MPLMCYVWIVSTLIQPVYIPTMSFSPMLLMVSGMTGERAQ